MDTNDFQELRSVGLKSLLTPFPPIPPSVTEDLKKSIGPVWIGSKSICKPVWLQMPQNHDLLPFFETLLFY